MKFSGAVNSFLNLFLVIFLFAKCSSDDGTVIARVGDHTIKEKEYLERYTNYLLDAGVRDNYLTRQAILNNIVNETLLKYYDDNSAIENNPLYKTELKWAENQAVLAYLKDQEVYAKISVSDQELREAFLKVNEQIAARHLYAETLEEANNLYQLLQIGRTFDDLAKEVFTDSALANNGGYLGYFTWGDMEPEFEEAAYSLKVGEISKPVKINSGYSIIKLEDRVRKPIITENEFTNNRNHLISVLKLRKRSSSEKKYIEQVFDIDKVTFNDSILIKTLQNLKSLSNIEENGGSDSGHICAAYKDRKVTDTDLIDYLKELPPYHLVKLKTLDEVKAAIKGFILRDELYMIAQDKGYDDEKRVLETLGKMKLNLFLKYKRKEIVDKAEMSDSLLIDYYKNNIEQFTQPKMLSIQEIIVKTEKEANETKKLIDKGTNFGVLAERLSLRPDSRTNSGIISLSPLEYYGKFQDLFWNNEIGRVIGPVDLSGYYGLFKVLEKKDSTPIDFNEAHDSILGKVKVVYGKKIFQDYISELTKNVSIEINKEYLKSFKLDSNLQSNT